MTEKRLYQNNNTAGLVAEQLAQQAENVAAYLLPNGKRKISHWVVGSINGEEGGSLKIALTGEDAGLWVDHAIESQCGDMLDLWAEVRGLNLSGALREAKAYLGWQEPANNGQADSKPIAPKKPAVQATDSAQKRQQSRAKAKALWAKGKPAKEHPYTTRKGLEPDGLRVKGKLLLIPMYDANRKLTCIQKIDPDPKPGEEAKKFEYDCQAKDCYYPIGKPTDNTLIIVEGWATGKSIHLATELAVAVAFSSGNLSNVARIMRENHPDFEIVLAPDNDENRHAIEIAESAARQHHCQVVVPQFTEGMTGTDFDDLRQDAGLDEVKRQIMKCRYQPTAEVITVETWPEREPLPERYDVMPFDYELLPAKLRPYIELGTHTMQCQPDYIATSCMVALGSLIGRKVCIRPKKHDDWIVVPNLWGGNVGLSTAMKSPAQDFGMRHLERIANNAIEIHKEEQRLSAPQRRRLEAEIHALSQKLKNHYRDTSKSELNPELVSEDLAKCEAELEELNDQHATRYWTTDSTIEKLAVLLNQNPNGLLNKRDELIGWFRSMDRPGREGDRAFFLESASGTQSITHDRIGRGTIHCEGLCLSIHGSIQPGPLQHYVMDALGDGVGADGLLQRFQLMVWPDSIKQWRYVDESLESANDALAASVFDHLVDITVQSVGATVPEDGVPYLRFSDAAQEVFIQWFTDLHREKVPNAEHEALRSHLGKYSSLMPSLALILHLADGNTGPVSLEAAVKAADWCEYLGTHARRVYLSNTRPDVVAAHRILRKVEESAITHAMKVRDIIRAQWSGLNSRERVEAGLGVLEEHGWLRTERVETGGRPSDQINLHPDIRNTNNSSSISEADHG